ncbi:MAG TPA: SUMF1/EgtB/PvdO family nonheme iron enzyme, partial [Burkholderiales bacterium]
VPHGIRWDLPLPTLEQTLGYLERVLAAVLEGIEGGQAGPETAYFAQLAAFHEDMHNEAFDMMRQLLGYAPPAHCREPAPGAASWPGDAEVPGGEFMLGAQLGDGFVFDNEKWAHPVQVRPFRIARAPVTHREFAAFVEDGGYARSELWSAAGWRWRERAGAVAPACWCGRPGDWRLRWFDRELPLPPDAPVMQVSWHEAQAWCRWAGRRLPGEAEWELAAAETPGGDGRRRYPWGDAPPDAKRANLLGVAGAPADVAAYAEGDSGRGCRQMLGNVWEWTASDFLPYPGFVVDPYRDYSAPWFASHKVLRGGSFASAPRLLRNTFRNFYTPDRRDVFAGFRSCARD